MKELFNPAKFGQLILKHWSRPTTRAVIIITGFSLLSRGLGFIRQGLIYGNMDKVASDLLLAANKIPENISQLLITGTIISALLPVASRLEHSDKPSWISKYLNKMLVTILIGIASINLLALYFTPQILALPFVTSTSAQDFFQTQGLWHDYILVTRILLLGPLLFALQAVINVFLFLKKRYVVYSLAGVVYNIGAIFGVILAGRNGYTFTAIGMVVGAFLSVLLYIWEAKRFGYKLVLPNKAETKELSPEVSNTWAVALPRVFILDAVITANLLITPFAQTPGQITAVDIGLSLAGAFFILITSLGTVVFPDLTKLFQTIDKNNHFWPRFLHYIQRALLLSVGVTVLTLIGSPVIMWLFERFGKGQGNSDYIITLSQIAAVGIFLRALREIMGKYFFIRERLWQPVILSIAAIVGQVVMAISLANFGIDAGVNIMWGFSVNNLIWFILAFAMIYNDWQNRQLAKPIVAAT